MVTDVLPVPIKANDFPLVDRLLEAMQRVQIYELGILDIRLINIDQQWVISDKGYTKLEESEDLQLFRSSSPLDRQFKWITRTVEGKAGKPPQTNVFLFKQFPNLSAKPSAFLVTQMSNQELFKVLPKSSDLGSLIILDDKGNIIATDMASSLDTTVRNTPLLKEMTEAPDPTGYRIQKWVRKNTVSLTANRPITGGHTYLSFH